MIKVVVTVIVVIAGLALAAAFGPLKSWLPTFSPPAQQTPQATPTQPPPPTQPATTPIPTQAPPTAPPPTTTPKKVTRTFTEKELQDTVNALIPTINQSGQAKIDYLQVKLEQDRMLVSAKGQFQGIQAETENFEMRFDVKTVSATGQLAAFGFTPIMTVVADITCDAGKPKIEITSFTSTGMLFLKPLGITKEKISQMINDAIVSKGLTILCRVESIRIENAKLILEYTQ